MTSPDLVTWTNSATPAAYNIAVRSEALGLFVAAGTTGNTGYSAAGTSWTAGTALANDSWGTLAVTN